MGLCSATGHIPDPAVVEPLTESQQTQRSLGPQSLRGEASLKPLGHLKEDPFLLERFDELFKNEAELCTDYAAFYHSYSFAAILYEVRASLAAALYGFRAENGCAPPLPRLLLRHFEETPDAPSLMRRVQEEWGPTKSDHNAAFRRVGISAMLSIVSTGPECSIPVAFTRGYSCKQIDFKGLLRGELEFICRDDDKVDALAVEILRLAERYGLDTSVFGGPAYTEENSGHLLQIFVRRSLIDTLCYPAKPYGEIDAERMPFSEYINGDQSFAIGQARLLAHPKMFMDPDAVRLFTVSANPTFQAGRPRFQEELTELIRTLPGARPSAAPDGKDAPCQPVESRRRDSPAAEGRERDSAAAKTRSAVCACL